MKAVEPVAEGLAFERDLARSIAWVRVVLCAINVLAILLDTSFAGPGRYASFNLALGVAGAFFLYSFLAVAVVSLSKRSLQTYFVVTPLLDVAFSSVLVLVTDGYLSPFTIWLVFCVVGSGFSRYRWMPLVTAFLGIGVQLFIATIPQKLPLDVGVFVVRTAYLFGFSTILAAVGAFVVSQSRYWRLLEHAGAEYSEAGDFSAVMKSLTSAIMQVGSVTRVSPKAEAVPVEDEEAEEAPTYGTKYEFEVVTARERTVLLEVESARPLNRVDQACIRALCHRATATFERIDAIEKLVDYSIREERLSLADELHDGYIQTLSAVDLRVESIRRKLEDEDSAISEELAEIKTIVRAAAITARNLITPIVEDDPPSYARVVSTLKERWQGELVYDQKGPTLSEEKWRLIELAAKEAANNAKKHGEATKLVMTAEQSEDSCVVTFQDNGTGPGKNPEFGYGLRRLSSAVESHGGSVELGTSEEGGAVVRVELPV